MPTQTTSTRPTYISGASDAGSILSESASDYILGKRMSNTPFEENLRSTANHQAELTTYQALVNLGRMTGTSDPGNIESLTKSVDKTKKTSLAQAYAEMDEQTRELFTKLAQSLATQQPQVESKTSDSSKPWLDQAGQLLSFGGGMALGKTA